MAKDQTTEPTPEQTDEGPWMEPPEHDDEEQKIIYSCTSCNFATRFEAQTIRRKGKHHCPSCDTLLKQTL